MDAIKKRLYLNQNNDSKPNNNDSRINMSVKTPTPILNKSRANDYELSLKRRCEKILLSSSSSASSEVEIEVQKNKNKLNFKKKEEISNSKFSSDRNKEISKNKNGDLLDLEYKKFIEMKKNKFSKKSSMHNNDSFSD